MNINVIYILFAILIAVIAQATNINLANNTSIILLLLLALAGLGNNSNNNHCCVGSNQRSFI